MLVAQLHLNAQFDGGVAVTAPTGIAASHVQGVTIHSWAGIGLGKGAPAKNGASSNSYIRFHWTGALELSLMVLDHFDATG